MTKVTSSVTLEHEKGLHARPTSVFVRTASDFDADVSVSKSDGESTADAKSSIGVISLSVESGDEIEITAEGMDAHQAVDRLVELVEADFELNDNGT